MTATALNSDSRNRARARMSSGKTLDLLIIGGGVTGAGIALDAVTRGLRVAVVEAQDWASGTSSRSSKLLHGGLRYLQMLDFKLVHEAILERNLLLKTIAPHLAVPVPFLFPLTKPVIERSYVGAGVALYDALSFLGGTPAVPGHRHLSKQGMHRAFEGLRDDAFVGAIQYYDARIDDARLVSTLVRTAAHHGALAASRMRVTSLTKDAEGRINGATIADLLAGDEFAVSAKHVINATGVWTEQTEQLADTDAGLQVLASKGAHIVVPKQKIRGRSGIISQTEKSVLFVIPWQEYWLIGTTDTPWSQDLEHPVATARDIAYLLDKVNEILKDPISESDIIGTFAGLRPLLQPETKGALLSTKVSREHTVAEPVPGLTVVAGGKLTTYRVMAKDTVDFALGADGASKHPSATKTTPLLGAQGLAGIVAKRDEIEQIYGWSRSRVNRLINRYGTMLYEILELIGVEPDLGEPVAKAPEYLRAEIAYAVTAEGALRLEDVMLSRTRLGYEQRDRGVGAASEISQIMAPLLGWSDAQRKRQVAAYKQRAKAETDAEKAPDDATAAQIMSRLQLSE